MHTLISIQPKFEIVNKCDKTPEMNGEGTEGGGGERQKANVKRVCGEIRKQAQNERRYGKEVGLKHKPATPLVLQRSGEATSLCVFTKV